MARDLLIPIAFVLSCTAPAFADTEVALALNSTCAADTSIFDIARRETTRIWSSAGVRVRWMRAADLPYRSSSPWLVVQCVASHKGLTAGIQVPIAAIRFIDARPTNTIVVSVPNARTLLARDVLESRLLIERFRALRERRLGRVIGRAIAHEVGHFLASSGAHTPRGLMRAAHPVADLIGDSLNPFSIDPQMFARQVARADEPVEADGRRNR